MAEIDTLFAWAALMRSSYGSLGHIPIEHMEMVRERWAGAHGLWMHYKTGLRRFINACDRLDVHQSAHLREILRELTSYLMVHSRDFYETVIVGRPSKATKDLGTWRVELDYANGKHTVHWGVWPWQR